MPRPKAAATPKAKKTAPKKAAPKKAAAKRSRRSPYELVQELRIKRDKLREAMEARIAKLDSRIATLETKHEHKIKVSELLASHTPEDLEKELETLRTQQSLLRKALKQQSKS